MRAAEERYPNYPDSIPELMERAGRAVAHEAMRAFPDARRFACVCGGGSNGGDGRVAADVLREAGLVADETSDVDGYDVIVDALFGTGLPRRAAAGGGGAHRADERGPRAGRLRRPPLRRRRVDRRDRGRGGRGRAHGDLPRAQGRCRRRAGQVPRRRGRRLRHRPRGRRHGASEGDVRSAGRRPAACPGRYEVQGRRRRRRRRPPGDDGCGMPVRSRGTSSGCRLRHAGCAARVAACDRGHGARAGQGRLERGGRGGGRAAGRGARGGGGDRPRPRTR